MRQAIYRHDKAAKIEGSQIPNGALVEFLGRRFKKMQKFAIRYNGVVYWTSYGCLKFI